MCLIHNYEKWRDVKIFTANGSDVVLQARKCCECGKLKFRQADAGLGSYALTKVEMIMAGAWEPKRVAA